VEFELERDIDLAVQDVREQIAAVRRRLPDDIDEPVIQKVNPDATPVLWLNLAGEKSITRALHLCRRDPQGTAPEDRGGGIPVLGGLQRRQIRIWLDQKSSGPTG
jgi:multidrug efflux pump subunit AcrB